MAIEKKPQPLQVFGTPGPGTAPVIFHAMTACDCGCGRPARFLFCIGQDTVAIADPKAIRALITEMEAGYALLWGPQETRDANPG
jgi:hypothetical protein